MYNGLTAKLMLDDKTIGYISNWSVEETRDLVEVTKLGSKEKEKFPTMYSWTASADGTADFEGESAQVALREAMLGGSLVAVKFYLNDTRYLTGSAYVESLSVDISAEDKGNISISLSGVGELKMQTQSQSNPA